mmetsp:Transcript_33852/g.48094  ORF Transcript_33852/g.48094 Transcript_33852/m.48094 type:complete len:168 (-) Transcript_33852:508-1011(-)
MEERNTKLSSRWHNKNHSCKNDEKGKKLASVEGSPRNNRMPHPHQTEESNESPNANSRKVEFLQPTAVETLSSAMMRTQGMARKSPKDDPRPRYLRRNSTVATILFRSNREDSSCTSRQLTSKALEEAYSLFEKEDNPNRPKRQRSDTSSCVHQVAPNDGTKRPKTG